jgi:hypothetical protein
MTDSTTPNSANNCLGRTCLKWASDGELTALDLRLVMERLAEVDPEVAAQRVLADGEQLVLNADAQQEWERINSRPARNLPGLSRLLERPSPCDPPAAANARGGRSHV